MRFSIISIKAGENVSQNWPLCISMGTVQKRVYAVLCRLLTSFVEYTCLRSMPSKKHIVFNKCLFISDKNALFMFLHRNRIPPQFFLAEVSTLHY